MKQYILLAIITAVIMFAACNKDSDIRITGSELEKKNDIKTSRTEEEELAQRLMNDFGLVVLSPEQVGNMQTQSFTTYEEAAAYITELQQQINTPYYGEPQVQPGGGTVPLDKFIDPPPPTCTNSGWYHASLPGSGGMLSNFRIYFHSNGNGITTASVTLVGTPIGISWSQIMSSFNGNGNSGCVGGTLTSGLTVGNLTLGLVQEYHFSFSFNPATCTLAWSQGIGAC